MDPLVLSLLSTESLRFMTNANQFSGGRQGWIIRRLGAFPVNLSRPSVTSLRGAIELLHTRHKLVIFPEGGIARDQPLRQFKPGLARLVLQAELSAPQEMTVPVIPIALRYIPDVEPKARISIRVSPPVYRHQLNRATHKENAQALTQTLYSTILESLKV